MYILFCIFCIINIFCIFPFYIFCILENDCAYFACSAYLLHINLHILHIYLHFHCILCTYCFAYFAYSTCLFVYFHHCLVPHPRAQPEHIDVPPPTSVLAVFCSITRWRNWGWGAHLIHLHPTPQHFLQPHLWFLVPAIVCISSGISLLSLVELKQHMHNM